MKIDVFPKIIMPLEVSPVALYLAATWQFMPFSAKIMVLCYIGLWLVYCFLPWKYSKWNSKKLSLVHLKKKLRATHGFLVSILLAFPMILMGAYHAVEKAPNLLDFLHKTQAEVSSKIVPLSITSITPDKLPSENPGTFIALRGKIATDNQVELRIVTAENFFSYTTRQCLYRLTQFVMGIFVLSCIFIFCAYIAEPIAEMFAEHNHAGGSA